jgi:hypothetical protein
LLSDAAFFFRVGGQAPAEGLVEEVTVKIKGSFNQFAISSGGIDRSEVIGKQRRKDANGIYPACPDRPHPKQEPPEPNPVYSAKLDDIKTNACH